MLNGDRGKVDYTVSTGDLMTDTHNAPSADDRHHEEWTDEDAKSKCCITKSLQTMHYSSGKSLNLNSRVDCFEELCARTFISRSTLPLDDPRLPICDLS